MNEIKALEHPTLKVPYEVLNKKYRQAQKVLDGEARQVANVVTEVENGLDRENVPAGDIKKLLGGMVERLQTMKRKASEAINEELSAGCVCKRRLDHLKEHAANIEESDTPQSDDPLIRQAALSQWRKTRLDRMLVDYFLRYGYYNAANQLADAMDIRDLTNVDIFRVAADVESDLEKHNTTRCLQWCQDNKSKLRKLKSNMEFNVRIQEFIEMVRQDRRLDAVKYARRHFSVFEQDQLAEIQHCMGMLAFPKDTEVEPYAGLLSTTRWGSLIEQFRSWHWKLLQPAQQPALAVALQVGLAALKTPQCYSTSGKVASCPVCSPPLNQLAAALPHAHCSQSRLVCRISGEPLNEHNHPMMLPNGQVYGEKALKDMMKEHGAIICPKTKEVFCMKRVEKVFVM